MAVLFQFRRDTAANWTSTDPVMAQGEIGLELDTNNIKVGDGVTAWTSLAYFTGSGITDEDIDDRVAALLQAGNGIDLNYDDVNNELIITSEVTEITAYNGTGVTIPKGSVVYQTGVQGNDISVALADNSSAATMPASGIVIADIADMSTGQIAVAGFVKNLSTSAFSVGDTLYVGSSGALTATRPTGESTLVESFGKAIKINAASGEILVSGAGRSNDVPNLADGNVFIGNISNVAEKRALVEADISDFGTYLTAEADTLDSVTGRGSTTTNDITVQNATVNGDLNVAGTTTTINTANLNVADKNITINYSTGDSSITADGAGITIQDAVDAATDATILWDATNDEFDFSHDITVPGATITNGLTVDGTTLVVDDTANQVLLGTATAYTGDRLNVSGAATFFGGSTQVIRLISSSDTGSSEVRFGDPTSPGAGQYKFNHDGNIHEMISGGVTAATFGGTKAYIPNRLGIGTSSPSVALDVVGAAKLTSSLTMADSQSVIWGASGNRPFVNGDSAANSLSLGTAGTVRATINSAGNVGIGENNPQVPLHVSTTGANFATLRLDAAENTVPASFLLRSHDGVFDIRDAIASATRMTIDSSGNVGIGSDSPTAPLSILESDSSATIGGSGSVIKVRNPSGIIGSTSGLEFFHGNVETNVQRLCGIYGQYDQFDAAGFGGDLVFATQTAGASSVSERMRIDQDGNVGIGETAPVRKLHVGDAMRLEPTSTPASPSAGDLYFDSTTNKLRCYDGTTWQDCF